MSSSMKQDFFSSFTNSVFSFMSETSLLTKSSVEGIKDLSLCSEL